MKTYIEQAEECLTKARWAQDADEQQTAMYWLARAQVYATLAHMAETRDK